MTAWISGISDEKRVSWVGGSDWELLRHLLVDFYPKKGKGVGVLQGISHRKGCGATRLDAEE